jgi:hypothetical protein
MNERIQQLAEQAVYYDKDEESWEFDRKKFAELIITECIYNAFCNGDDIEYVKKHFGVK